MPRKPQQKGDHYYDPFPKRLRKLIEERNWKQEDLIETLGVKTRQSVTGYIDGSTVPTAEKIAAISREFHVSADWLLGLTEVRSPEMDLRAVCSFTGLSEDAINVLKLGGTVPRALNLLAEKPQWAGDDWNVFKSPLWQLCAALAKLERAAIPAAVEALNNDPAGEYFDAAQKKESLELELFRFEKACREIPAAVFRSDVLHERLTEIEARRYQAKIQELLQEQEKEAYNG